MAKKSKKAGIPHALERAGALSLAFGNTGVPRRDDRRKDGKAPPEVPLESYDELVTWSQRMGTLTATDAEKLHALAAERPADAESVRGQAAELRSAIVRIFTARVLGKEPRPQDLATMNSHLRPRSAVPAGDGYRWDWTGDDSALDRPLWAVAQSAAELLISDDLARVDQCTARGCFQLFVSRSKRRLWCDMNTCGNRLKGRRHQQVWREIRESNDRRNAEEVRAFHQDKATAAAEAAGSKAPLSPPQEAEERLDTNPPTDPEGSEQLPRRRSNRTVA